MFVNLYSVFGVFSFIFYEDNWTLIVGHFFKFSLVFLKVYFMEDWFKIILLGITQRKVLLRKFVKH